MTGDLISTLVDSLSMIDRGFTVSLTVTPHNWVGEYDGDHDEDDETQPSEDVIEGIKDFARDISKIPEYVKEGFKEEYARVVRDMDVAICDAAKGTVFPSVGDEVWYKTKKFNYNHGKVKVVCHNTIQLDNNVTLERKDCIKEPFKVGDEVWYMEDNKVAHKSVIGLRTDHLLVSNYHRLPYERVFHSVDDLLGYLKSTADE